MPKRIVDPKSGAVIFKATPEEQENQKLKKRVTILEHKVQELETLINKLLEVINNE